MLTRTQIEQILTLSEIGRSIRQIAELIGVSRNTFRKYVRRKNLPLTPRQRKRDAIDEK
jgi:transposase|uniref:helix-turn-helix domain-containing protein n=1 Tax=Mesosutterella multiformis TaxID=2259133 RepID=UPI0040268F20